MTPMGNKKAGIARRFPNLQMRVVASAPRRAISREAEKTRFSARVPQPGLVLFLVEIFHDQPADELPIHVGGVLAEVQVQAP